MKISKALRSENDTIKKYWKQSFPEAQGDAIDAYFDVYFKSDETLVLRNENQEILAMAQMKPKVIQLGDKKLKTSYITHVMTRPEYQGQGYMKKMMSLILENNVKEQILTVLKPYEPSVFRSLGFENVLMVTEYNIQAKHIPSLSVDGIILGPSPKDLLKVYETFTQYFDGYFKRDLKYYEDLFQYITARKGKIIGIKEKNKMVGYCVYLMYPTHIEVLECAYDTSGTLIKFLSFVSRGKHRVILKASTSERIHKLFPNAIKTTQPFMMARINDKALFERLYGVKILSAYSAFNVSAKPHFNRDFQ